MKIPIEKIIVSKDNPRQSFDEEGLRRLGESIKEHGQLQAVIVRPKGSSYELVVGERRLRACILAGLSEIETSIQNLDDKKCDFFRVVENTQREDLTEAEKGNAITNILKKYPDLTLADIAKEANKAEGTISNWVYNSNQISDFVRKSQRTLKLSVDGVRRLLTMPDETQEKLARALVKFKIKGAQLQVEFIKQYALHPEKYPTIDSLEDLANEVKGIKKVKIDLDKLSPKARAEVERKLAEAKKEAAALRKATSKPRVNCGPQGRPPKTKKKPDIVTKENEPSSKPTFPIAQVKVVSIAVNFPESLWETVLRYTETTDKPMLVEEAVISLLESHPLLKGL